MLNLLRAHWVSMTVGVLLLSVTTALILVQPLLAGSLVDRAAAGSPVFASAVVLLGLLATQLILESLGHFQLDRVGERVVLALRADFTTQVVRLPVGLLDRIRGGELLARGASDTALVGGMPRAVGDVVFGFLTLLGAGALMLTIDALTLGIVIVVMAVAFTIGNLSLSRIQRASARRQEAVGDYTAGLDRSLGAARTIKVFGAEDREVRSIGQSARSAYRAGVRIASSTALSVGIVRFGVTGSFLAIMIIDGRRVGGGDMSVGQFVSLFAFALYAVFPVTAAFGALAALRTSSGAYQHLVVTLRELPESEPLSRTSTADLTVSPGSPLVRFDTVAFSYGATTVLEDISFTLARDQITALIGPSGAGKSTILALLCRFHDPDSGVVTWEGRDVRTMALRDLRDRLGLLEQDAPVLHGSIRENLLIADPEAGEGDLWRVLEQASIADEIAALPQRLDTAVLDRGRSLSGGQRQRLALARAFLSRSELILMDEPTAHLDRANEYDVMTNLLQARGRRSVLVVAHRLSTVTNADQILVLQRGRIEASGTHAELVHLPAYRELIEHQLARD